MNKTGKIVGVGLLLALVAGTTSAAAGSGRSRRAGSTGRARPGLFLGAAARRRWGFSSGCVPAWTNAVARFAARPRGSCSTGRRSLPAMLTGGVIPSVLPGDALGEGLAEVGRVRDGGPGTEGRPGSQAAAGRRAVPRHARLPLLPGRGQRGSSPPSAPTAANAFATRPRWSSAAGAAAPRRRSRRSTPPSPERKPTATRRSGRSACGARPPSHWSGACRATCNSHPPPRLRL